MNGRAFLLKSSAWVASEEKENGHFGKVCGRGLPACRMASILSETAGANDKILIFINGLIVWPA
jgi:hypothetical protein